MEQKNPVKPINLQFFTVHSNAVYSHKMSASLFVENENNGESVSSGASISEKCIICWRNFAHCNSDGYLATGKIGNSTQIYFIFKHIFQLTQEQLESFLITGTDPDSWAKTCETCSKNYVQDCWRLWIQLCDAQREFEGSRLKLIEAIKSAECRPIRIREKQGNLDISVETRRFVLKSTYRHYNQKLLLNRHKNLTVNVACFR